VGGELLKLHWSNGALFLAAAVPAFISLLAILTLRWVIKPATSAAQTREALAH
jgi:hypothetical protein